jgi:hypothetical protein
MTDDTPLSAPPHPPVAEPGARHIELRRRNKPSLWAVVDEADYERVMTHKWHAACSLRVTYAAASVRINGRRTTISLHRFILDVLDDASVEVDHIDTDGLNNRRSNLRLASRAENSRNRRSRRGTSSRYKGVSWNKNAKAWVANIARDGRMMYLGYFSSEIEAARAYDYEAVVLHGDFARLNFPEERLRGDVA